jgi:hypothetical protein
LPPIAPSPSHTSVRGTAANAEIRRHQPANRSSPRRVGINTRYRLNRYGDRQLNNALHTVVPSRIQYQPATRDYVARRTAEGKTGREIKRCLARYVARDLYRLLENTATAA